MFHRPLFGLLLATALAGPLGLSGACAQPDAPPVVAPQMPASVERLPTKLARLASQLGRDGDVRIVAFGSSSTEGAGASSPAMAYPALLERDLEERLQIGASSRRSITVINRGKGGDTAEAMARRLERDVLAERPDLVVWQTGSNDPLAGVPLERFVELTRAGILAIRATGADVVLMDQQWCSKLSGMDGAERYGEALHALARTPRAGDPPPRPHAVLGLARPVDPSPDDRPRWPSHDRCRLPPTRQGRRRPDPRRRRPDPALARPELTGQGWLSRS